MPAQHYPRSQTSLGVDSPIPDRTLWAAVMPANVRDRRRSDAGPVPESIAAVAAAEAAQLVGWSRAPSTATRPPPIARLRTSDRIVENGGASPSRRCGWCQHRYQ